MPTLVEPDMSEEVKNAILALIDEFTSEIIVCRHNRLENWKAVKYFLDLLPQDLRLEKETNELIATILTSISSRPYNIEFEDSKQTSSERLFEHMPAPPMMYWSFDHWERLSDLFFKLMAKLGAKQDSELETVMQRISLNQKLVKVRSLLEEQVINEKSGPLKIQGGVLDDFISSLQSDDEKSVENELSHLFVEGMNGVKKLPATLKQLQDLEPILHSEPFDFGHFIRKVEKLVGLWAWKCAPSLKKLLSNASRVDSEETKDVENATKDATKAKSVAGKMNLNGKTKLSSTFQLGGIEIADDDNDDDNDEGDISFNSGGKRRRIKNSPAKKVSPRQRQSPTAPHRPDGRRRRVPWTDEEKAAIRQGVRIYSVGQWAKIKAKFKVELANRTAVQVKDQYRTMCKRGEA